MVGTAGPSRPCAFEEGQSVRWASGPYRGCLFMAVGRLGQPSLPGGGGLGQDQAHFGAAEGGAADFELAAVVFGGGAHDEEAQAGAAGFGRSRRVAKLGNLQAVGEAP